MDKTHNVRRSNVIFKIASLNSSLTLKTFDISIVNNHFFHWKTKRNVLEQDIKNNSCPFITIPKNIKKPLLTNEIQLLRETAEIIINTYNKTAGKSIAYKQSNSHM